MLPLEHPGWNDLQHAFGNAGDVPALLKTLASSTGPQQDHLGEPWFSLWSMLCHQGGVYTSSYVAVPHIVQIAVDAKEPIDFGFFQLPTAIEIARLRGKGPDIPDAYSEDYHRAIAQLTENAYFHRHEAWDQSMLLSVAAAQAVAKGHVDIAEALLNLDADWIAQINNCEFD